ncbi:hypothetical protein COV61_04380 [Candidatus Micrarchaeota archaeon CG11_big_fil_rev_8_21_14_0_20_47_5]|nr:MAG: hypothetical protein AUJ17_03010 [Candidatus Micrarchaeota archaeon CG1_02_47_40]PIN83001.1 MAG: hypothetical protein COV61_04380 [Candidatus Micrarchaeota archaeon CG11_big_fil_rev_8_21_14_0_20_47_5]
MEVEGMRHIVVVAEDKRGLLADISYLLGKAKINMENVSVEVVGTKSIVRIFVKNEEKAEKVLSANGYKVLSHDNLVLRIEDKPGEWSKAAELLKKEGIELKNVSLITKGKKYHFYSIVTDRNKRAEKILADYVWSEGEL